MCQHLESSIPNHCSDFQKTGAIPSGMCFTGQGKSALWFYAWESWESCVSEAIRTVELYLHEQSQRWWFQHRLADTARPSPSGRTAGPRLPSGELLWMQVASRSEPRTSKEDHFEWHSNVNLRKVSEIVFFNQNTNTLMSSLIFFKNSKTVVSKHIQEVLKI